MAHIIAHSANGPRGGVKSGDDNYVNLILLCPTHHTIIDKAPEGQFTVERLLQWKATHERRIEESLAAQIFADRTQLDTFISRRLIENHTCWMIYGPESATAKANPNSTAGFFWPFRKLSHIVPNNRQIISAIRSNDALFGLNEYRVACEFVEHAEGFERNCTVQTENVPRFPVEFGNMFNDKR